MCYENVSVQSYGSYAPQLMFIEPTQSQHKGGVANGPINFTNCSLPHSSLLHGGMLCTAAMVTPLAKSSHSSDSSHPL